MERRSPPVLEMTGGLGLEFRANGVDRESLANALEGL